MAHFFMFQMNAHPYWQSLPSFQCAKAQPACITGATSQGSKGTLRLTIICLYVPTETENKLNFPAMILPERSCSEFTITYLQEKLALSHTHTTQLFSRKICISMSKLYKSKTRMEYNKTKNAPLHRNLHNPHPSIF